MTNEKYNGWTNYATWRVNLEMFDGTSFIEDKTLNINQLAHALKEYAEDYLINDTGTGLAIDYALAFIADVNWYEIAQSMINNLETKETI